MQLLVIILIALIVGCSGKTSTTSPVVSADEMDGFPKVPFATDRNQVLDGGVFDGFGDERGPLSAGYCTVELKGLDALKRKARFLGAGLVL